MKAVNDIQRFILLYRDGVYELDQGAKEILDNASEKTYLTRKELNKLIHKLEKLGFVWEESDNMHIQGVLRLVCKRIFILRAGRTAEEVSDAVWRWLKRHKDKKLHIDIRKPGDTIFVENFLELFKIVGEDEEDLGDSFEGCGYFKGQKKQLAELIECFVLRYVPIEFCYYDDIYYKFWGLEDDEKTLSLRKGTSNDIRNSYIKLAV